MWLGRQDLSNRYFRRILVIIGLGAIAIVENISNAVFYLAYSFGTGTDSETLLLWFDIDPWEPLPLFMITGGGTALVVITVCTMVVEKWHDAGWLAPFVVVGRSTLTLYAVHILFGIIALKVLDTLGVGHRLFPLLGAMLFFGVSLVFCHFWTRRFEKGPLETVLQKFIRFRSSGSGRVLSGKRLNSFLRHPILKKPSVE
jgi:uncharacterized membrane protein YeiB